MMLGTNSPEGNDSIRVEIDSSTACCQRMSDNVERGQLARLMKNQHGGNNRAMNIYFSCSLTGGRQDESVYMTIVDHLLAIGHDVPTAHLAHPEVMDLEMVVDAREVYERDMAWIEGCDVLIAEVSTPSHGVGYEIAVALKDGKPVLCCYREGATVSKMITGNDSKTLTLCAYRGTEDVLTTIGDFLKTLPGA